MKWMCVGEFIILLAAPVGNMRRILCFNCPPEWAHLARRVFPSWIQREKKNCLEYTDKFLNILTITEMRSQKAPKDR